MKANKFFIEIGSCDFDTLNILGKNGWSGIIVEPISEYLSALEKIDAVEYVNCAIDTESGFREMNTFKEGIVKNDHDYAGMSSFTEYTHPLNKELVEPRTVRTMTYQELIHTYNVERVDFLKIDTEGHDFEILKTVDFTAPQRPHLIKLEHKHLRGQEHLVEEFLHHNGYHTYFELSDIYAIDLF